MVKPTATGNSSPSSSSSSCDRSDHQSCYRGVRKRKWGKWVSEVRLPNSRQRIWLGSYDAPEKAARAFDAATFCLRGRTGRFNFPDSLPDSISGGGGGMSLMTPSEIQAFAARFANEGLSAAASSSQQPSGGSDSGAPEISCDLAVDWSSLYIDPSSSVGSESDFGYFPTYGEFPGDEEMFAPTPPPPPPPLPEVDNLGENNIGACYFSQTLNLWNF